VSNRVNKNNLTLGQAEEDNKITEIPKLLDLIDVSRYTVKIDAMEYQTAIVTKIQKNRQIILFLSTLAIL